MTKILCLYKMFRISYGSVAIPEQGSGNISAEGVSRWEELESREDCEMSSLHHASHCNHVLLTKYGGLDQAVSASVARQGWKRDSVKDFRKGEGSLPSVVHLLVTLSGSNSLYHRWHWFNEMGHNKTKMFISGKETGKGRFVGVEGDERAVKIVTRMCYVHVWDCRRTNLTEKQVNTLAITTQDDRQCPKYSVLWSAY